MKKNENEKNEAVSIANPRLVGFVGLVSHYAKQGSESFCMHYWLPEHQYSDECLVLMQETCNCRIKDVQTGQGEGYYRVLLL